MARRKRASGRHRGMCHRNANPRHYGPVARWLSRASLRCFGWRVEGQLPALDKYVVIAAPHTSNWDLLVMLLASRPLGLGGLFMMKDSVFWWPAGVLWRRLGGIPINRRAAGSVVPQILQYFDENPSIRLIITPEGTRKAVKHWKLGFYWIAAGAGVPILLAFIDHKGKTAGVGPVIQPTGDLEADFAQFRAFYQARVGVRPEYRLRPGEAERILDRLPRRGTVSPPVSTRLPQP